jgi:hypothetical protein
MAQGCIDMYFVFLTGIAPRDDRLQRATSSDGPFDGANVSSPAENTSWEMCVRELWCKQGEAKLQRVGCNAVAGEIWSGVG